MAAKLYFKETRGSVPNSLMNSHKERTPPMRSLVLLFCLVVLSLYVAPSACEGSRQPSDTLRVPAFTAYSEPDSEATEVSEQSGITGWTEARNQVVWYGDFKTTGRLNLALSLRLPGTTASR